jgi:hypothetical protein
MVSLRFSLICSGVTKSELALIPFPDIEKKNKTKMGNKLIFFMLQT